MIEQGIEAREIKRKVDPQKFAALLISSLEGALMMSRLEKNSEALFAIQSYLDTYLENEVRRRKPEASRISRSGNQSGYESIP